jgi:hypothetical protein
MSGSTAPLPSSRDQESLSASVQKLFIERSMRADKRVCLHAMCRFRQKLLPDD